MFELTQEQHSKLAEWIAANKNRYSGAIGGRYSFIFTPTSLGLAVRVEDNLTKESIDLTDTSDW